MISLRDAWREVTKGDRNDAKEIKKIVKYVGCVYEHGARLLKVHRAIEEFCDENVDYRVLYRLPNFPIIMLHDKEYTKEWYEKYFVRKRKIKYLLGDSFFNDNVRDALNLYYKENNIQEDTEANFISLLNQLDDMRMNEK